MTRQIELSAGTIEYEDTGGEGPAIVLLGGLMTDASLWEDVIADLSPEHRCVAPTLPLGAHRHAMHADADLSPRGLARLVSEFLDRLDLDDVTLVGNDTGGALVQLLAGDGAPRVGRIVLVSCDAFENFPPGLTGKALVLTGKLSPTMFGLFMQQMRLRPLRRLPLAFGWLTMRGDAATARWIKPVLRQREIRRDTVRVLREIAAQRRLMLEAAACLPTFERPALVVWASQDLVQRDLLPGPGNPEQTRCGSTAVAHATSTASSSPPERRARAASPAGSTRSRKTLRNSVALSSWNEIRAPWPFSGSACSRDLRVERRVSRVVDQHAARVAGAGLGALHVADEPLGIHTGGLPGSCT
jgi:pimeloyl-ACP methyl ester carboxylesterase